MQWSEVTDRIFLTLTVQKILPTCLHVTDHVLTSFVNLRKNTD